MQQGRLRVLQLVRDVTRQAEIGILVDRTWDETGNVRFGTKDLWEGVGKGRRRLDGAKVNLADVVTKKTKDVLARMSRPKKAGQNRKGMGQRRETYESLKPNVAFAWLRVIWRETFDTFL